MSDEKEKHVIRNQRKGDPCYKVANDLAEVCCSVLWKVQLVSDELRYLSEEISNC